MASRTDLSFYFATLFIFPFFVVAVAAQVVSPRLVSGGDFIAFLNRRFVTANLPGAGAKHFDCDFDKDPLAARVLAEYGSMFAAADSVALPRKCIFVNSQEVADFQKTLKTRSADFAGARVELQTSALDTLEQARIDAEAEGLRISPFDPRVASRRDYNDSVRIWNKRMYPALEHWVGLDVISAEESFRVRNVPLIDQARVVLEWESRGYRFGTGRARSIFSSCSPPGASQHLSLIALDVNEYGDHRVRQILNRHGWYQTVVDDPGHFTFLGVPETELPARGLKLVPAGGFAYWVPDIRPKTSVQRPS